MKLKEKKTSLSNVNNETPLLYPNSSWLVEVHMDFFYVYVAFRIRNR
jgi:hypothetical protein